MCSPAVVYYRTTTPPLSHNMRKVFCSSAGENWERRIGLPGLPVHQRHRNEYRCMRLYRSSRSYLCKPPHFYWRTTLYAHSLYLGVYGFIHEQVYTGRQFTSGRLFTAAMYPWCINTPVICIIRSYAPRFKRK